MTRSLASAFTVIIVTAFAAGPVLAVEINLSSAEEIHPALLEHRGSKTLEEALAANSWKTTSTDDPNYGITGDVIWFSVDIAASERTKRILYLEDYLMDLNIYIARDGVLTQSHDLSLEARSSDPGHFRVIEKEITFEEGRSRLLMSARSARSSLWFPLELHSEDSFRRYRDRTNVVFGALFGSLLIMACFNLLVVISTRERSYRSYVFYVLSGFFFLASISGFVFQHLPGLPLYWVLRTNGITGALFTAMAAIFTQSFLQTKETYPTMNKLLYVPVVLSAFAVCWLFLPGVSLGANAQFRSWVGLLVVSLMPAAGVHAWRRGYVPARYFVLAFAAFFVGTCVFLLCVLGFLPRMFLFSRGIQLGTVVQMALLSLALSDRINTLRRALEAHTHELERAHRRLATSEKKYRTLIENTADVIVALDTQGRIVTVSNAVREALGYAPRMLEGKPVEDLLYRDHSTSLPVETLLFRDALMGLDFGPAQLKVALKSRHGERVLMFLRLERIISDEGPQVLGKMSPLIEDELAQFLYYERGRYFISSHIALSHKLNDRVTRNLIRFFPDDEADAIRICLREMIVNAIEHGNLGISFEEKTRVQDEGDYLDFLVRRQNLPEYRDRRVRVDYALSPQRCLFRVTDEGAGFNYRKMIAEETARLGDFSLGHGRGIAMARMIFDRVVYNERGNQVTLIKQIGSSKI